MQYIHASGLTGRTNNEVKRELKAIKAKNDEKKTTQLIRSENEIKTNQQPNQTPSQPVFFLLLLLLLLVVLTNRKLVA